MNSQSLHSILKIFLLWILFCSVINAENNGSGTKINSEVIGLTTQAGILAKIAYFQRGINTPTIIDPSIPSFLTGPGIFFDYKLNNQVSLSSELSMNFDISKSVDSGRIFQAGLFAKYWLNDAWGYIGAGPELFLGNTTINGVSVAETDIMLTFIVTGENIPIKEKINSTGHIRAGFSVFNNVNDKNLRFYVAYVLGLAYDLGQKK